MIDEERFERLLNMSKKQEAISQRDLVIIAMTEDKFKKLLIYMKLPENTSRTNLCEKFTELAKSAEI